MLIALSHGKTAVAKTAVDAPEGLVEAKTNEARDFVQVDMGPDARTTASAPISAPAPEPIAAEMNKPDRFGYMFDETPEIPIDNDAFDKLGRIGAAMIGNGLLGPSGMPSILTFFGQFIDHDVTANTDRDPKALTEFSIDRIDLVRNRRRKVTRQLGNLRRGSLRLDSVYGDGTTLDKVMRVDNEGPKMRIGRTTAAPDKIREFDLPRIGPDYIAVGNDPAKLPDTSDLRSDYGTVDRDKVALIGDGRNDENLLVAQMHLALLRLHNAYVDELAAEGFEGTPEQTFQEARKRTRWHYQWLIVNAYLPMLCDTATYKIVVEQEALIYSEFVARMQELQVGGLQIDEDSAPLPLEFSVAAFRHGHSMIRESYRLNDHANGNGVVSTATDIFQHIGRGGLGGLPTLDDDFVIDWSNFLDYEADRRTANHLDAALARGLDDLVNEPRPYLRNLAQRNLRRGYVLNLPYAQDVLAALDLYPDYANRLDIDALAVSELRGVKGGQVVIDEGYADHTPLWFYILAESELKSKGKSLGPLGSLIVAETLLGLIIFDTESYWHQEVDGARWNPPGSTPHDPDAPDYKDHAIARFSAMLVKAGVKA